MYRAILFAVPLACALAAPRAAAQSPAASLVRLPNTCSTWTLACTGSPVLGGALTWEAPELGWLIVGARSTGWNGQPLPQPLDALAPAFAGCVQLAALDVAYPVTLIGFNWVWVPHPEPVPIFGVRLDVPQHPGLLGLTFRAQGLGYDSSGPSVSDGWEITIGT